MYTMMQVCSEVDMTYQTLKYYCNEGLVTHVKRDKNNRRIFDEHGVKWIKDLSCLKRCSFSIQKMKDYLDLCLEGESTVKIRKEFLVRKRENLENTIQELEENIDQMEWTQDCYDDVVSGKKPYASNLSNIKNEK